MNIAILKKDSPFYPLFPNGVPIVNILMPNRANCGDEPTQDVYMVDLPKLTVAQFEAVAKMVHLQCDPGSDFMQAKAEMLERGLPLRAKHVASVASDSRAFL